MNRAAKYPLDANNDGTIDDRRDHASSGPRTHCTTTRDRPKPKITDNAVQPDPDDPDAPTGPGTGVEMIARMVYENVPSTGYVGVPIDDLGYKIPGDTTLSTRVTPISGPDGGTFVFAEGYDHLEQRCGRQY